MLVSGVEISEPADMWLKVIIVVLLLAVIGSLASGFYFLIKDRSGSPRLVWSLTTRVTLSAIILALIVYGHMSGQLEVSAPWLYR
ncbi:MULTISPECIES: twin transmembrane helix small protein [Kistimonas]|uniref:Twin transmembrane helix small protein n=1 Tax=Kistimonas scapharcae TaxID=1036133 RepID=A0ABP8V5Y0_9GAMM|nr:twin transmembrane helix small protein [Kistimonas asteriae]